MFRIIIRIQVVSLEDLLLLTDSKKLTQQMFPTHQHQLSQLIEIQR
jgi:hypothetical protein